jgi:hypothetical protein
MTAPESISLDSPDFASILSLASLDPELDEAPTPPEETPQANDAAVPAEEAVLLAGEAIVEAEEAPSPVIDEEALGEDLAVSLDLEMERDFGAIVRTAVDKIGGEILFEVENVPESGHVAAVSMGAGEARRFVLVIQPNDGSPLRVEPAEESASPLAALAESYAGLVDAYKKAA